MSDVSKWRLILFEGDATTARYARAEMRERRAHAADRPG